MCYMNGINPSSLNISSLEDRINLSDKIEIILAISTTLDGQTTAHYLSKLLNKRE